MARALRIIGLSLALASAPLATTAWAQPTPQQLQHARDLFADAQKQEREGNWSGALDTLKQVAAIKLTPGIQYHMALCKEKLGQLVEAYKDYQAAERDAAQQNVQDVLQAVRGPLAALKDKVARLKITVPSDVRDAKVLVDGAALDPGSFGVEIPVLPGDHRIEASLPGRSFDSGKVSPKAGEILQVLVIFPKVGDTKPVPTPVPTPAPSNTTPAQPAPQTTPAQTPTSTNTNATTTPPPESADDAPRSGRSRTGAIIATGGAVALIGGGVAAFLIADGKQSDARTQCATQVTCDDLRGPVRTWDTIALGAWIGGAIAGAVAVVLWLKPSKADSTSVLVGPGVVKGSF